MTSMIVLQQVEKTFGSVQAVRGVSFEVPAGQVVGILGPNGAGKTTTIRMVTGAIPPTAGTVRVDGLDSVSDSIAVRRRLGYLPEAAPVYREMRVADFLRFRGGLYGLTGRRCEEAIRRCADQCQLTSVLKRRTGQLSKGYRQRVGLAAALLHDPKVLILDEPTNGLDPVQIAETRKLIRDLSGTRTTLIVSHILPEVEKSCDRIILFARGRVQADGPPEKLVRDLPGAGRYTVEVTTTSSSGADAATVFRGVQGVESLEHTLLADGWTRLLIGFPSGTADQREVIARTAASANLLVRELRAQTATLEDVYLRLVAYAQAPDAELVGAAEKGAV